MRGRPGGPRLARRREPPAPRGGGGRGAAVSACWRRCGSTPWSDWRRVARPTPFGRRTPPTSWRWRSGPTPTSWGRTRWRGWTDSRLEHDNLRAALAWADDQAAGRHARAARGRAGPVLAVPLARAARGSVGWSGRWRGATARRPRGGPRRCSAPGSWPTCAATTRGPRCCTGRHWRSTAGWGIAGPRPGRSSTSAKPIAGQGGADHARLVFEESLALFRELGEQPLAAARAQEPRATGAAARRRCRRNGAPGGSAGALARGGIRLGAGGDADAPGRGHTGSGRPDTGDRALRGGPRPVRGARRQGRHGAGGRRAGGDRRRAGLAGTGGPAVRGGGRPARIR